MRCEYCTRKFGSIEVAHAVRYGNVDHDTDVFIPARDHFRDDS